MDDITKTAAGIGGMGQVDLNSSSMSVEDLMNFDITDVQAKSATAKPKGKYHVYLKEGKLEPRDTTNKDTGEEIQVPCVKLTFGILSVVSLVSDTDEEGNEINPAELTGETLMKTFWTVDTHKKLQYLKGFLCALLGEESKDVTGSIPRILGVMEENKIQSILTLVHRPNKEDPSSPYTDIKEAKKFVVGHSQLAANNGLLPTPAE